MLTAMFVALPFVLRNRLEIPLSDHWQIYVTALLVSLVGTVPLIMADDRQGKRWTVQLALLCQLAGCLLLGTIAQAEEEPAAFPYTVTEKTRERQLSAAMHRSFFHYSAPREIGGLDCHFCQRLQSERIIRIYVQG